MLAESILECVAALLILTYKLQPANNPRPCFSLTTAANYGHDYDDNAVIPSSRNPQNQIP